MLTHVTFLRAYTYTQFVTRCTHTTNPFHLNIDSNVHGRLMNCDNGVQLTNIYISVHVAPYKCRFRILNWLKHYVSHSVCPLPFSHQFVWMTKYHFNNDNFYRNWLKDFHFSRASSGTCSTHTHTNTTSAFASNLHSPHSIWIEFRNQINYTQWPNEIVISTFSHFTFKSIRMRPRQWSKRNSIQIIQPRDHKLMKTSNNAFRLTIRWVRSILFRVITNWNHRHINELLTNHLIVKWKYEPRPFYRLRQIANRRKYDYFF